MQQKAKDMIQALKNWKIQQDNMKKVEKMFQGQADYNKSIKPR